MVLNVHRNHKADEGRGEGGERGMEVGEEGADVVGRFYVALFSALEQTHCALVAPV